MPRSMHFVDVHVWRYSDSFERLPYLSPANQPPEGWWRLLPAPVMPLRLENPLSAHESVPPPARSTQLITRLRLRAPSADCEDLPPSEWQFDVLSEPFDELGLDLELLRQSFESTGLRRLRFGALRVPFVSLDEEGRGRARATLTMVPLAANLLVEVEHDRVPVNGGEIAATDFHAIAAHPMWSAQLGDAAGLGAALALRALTTLDRSAREIEASRTAVERRLFASVVEASKEQVVAEVRNPTQELFRLIENAGALRDAAGAALAVAPLAPSQANPETPFGRALRELARHQAAFDHARADCRETASAASDAASMVSLAEQAVQAQRGSALQRAFTIVTAVVLLPGLVAAIFGANVALPGKDEPLGTAGLLLAMAAGGCATVPSH